MFVSWGAVFSQPTDDQLIKDVVNSAYVMGIHNGGPLDDIRKGFHPSFSMLRLIDNQVKPLPIDEWITNIEKNRAQNPASTTKTEANFVSVTAVGNSGNVVLELSREGKKVFTDHLLLYKFNEGWRIVSKTYYRHP